MFIGEMTSAEVMGVVSNFDTETVRKSGLCEANFYSAIIAQREHRREEARGLYGFAARCCTGGSVEKYAANAELRQLDRLK
jgi:hypothetical protein